MLDADVADLVMVCDGHVLRAALPGDWNAFRNPQIDPVRRLFTVKVRAPERLSLAASPAVTAAIARAVHAGAVFTAAQLLGAGRKLLTDAVAL